MESYLGASVGKDPPKKLLRDWAGAGELKRTERDEALMVTLVHGDILVASGGVFEVCIRAFCCIDNKLIL